METDVFTAIIKRIDDEIERMVANLASGHAQSFESYRESVGVLAGLRIAKREVQEIEQKFIEE